MKSFACCIHVSDRHCEIWEHFVEQYFSNSLLELIMWYLFSACFQEPIQLWPEKFSGKRSARSTTYDSQNRPITGGDDGVHCTPRKISVNFKDNDRILLSVQNVTKLLGVLYYIFMCYRTRSRHSQNGHIFVTQGRLQSLG